MKFYIKEAAERMGLSTHTLRYYEKEGLLPFVKRDSNGNRIFDESDIAWLDLVICFRKTDIALSDLRKLVKLIQEGDHTATERKEIFIRHKEKMMEKQRDLAVALKKIDMKIEFYEELEKKYHKEKENNPFKS